MRFAVVALVLASCGAREHATDHRVQLAAPFDIGARREHAVAGPHLPALAFPAPPGRDVRGVSYYIDDKKSQIDPELAGENASAVAPIRDFMRAVTRRANLYVRTRPEQPELAAQTLDGLHAWADAGALTGDADAQGRYQRTWAVASLALAYLQIRDARLDTAKRDAVERWFGELGRVVRDGVGDGRRRDARNNHRYWAGVAAAAAGIAAGDRALYDWGMSAFDVFVAEEAEGGRAGTLPLELARGPRALHYHLFALEALEMLAQMGLANDDDPRPRGGGALGRLARRCVAGLADPAAFDQLAGAHQELGRRADAAWLEIELARTGAADVRARIDELERPLFDANLGGDTTLLFGVP